MAPYELGFAFALKSQRLVLRGRRARASTIVARASTIIARAVFRQVSHLRWFRDCVGFAFAFLQGGTKLKHNV